MKKRQSAPKKPMIPWYIAPVALLVLSLAVVALSPEPTVPPMDDSYIQLVFGRSLMTASPLSFNCGEPSSGFTSPLWLVPSALASVFGSGGAPVVLMLLSTIFAAGALAAAAPRTALIMVLTGPFLFHASSGMETAAACLLIVLLWRSVRDDSLPGWRPWILAGAILLRPELTVLAIPAVLVTWKRGWKATAYLLLPSASLGFLWVLWNLHAAGLPLPSTFYAKGAAGWTALAGAGILGLLENIAFTSVMLPLAAAVAVTGLIQGKLTKERLTGVALALFPILLTLAALVTQPNAWFQMRYFLPPLMAMVLVTGHWLSKIRRWKSNLAIVAISLVPGLVLFAGRRADATADVFAIDVSPAVWLAEHAEPGSTVAAADIGAIGWLSGLGVLDLDGLVTPDRLPGNAGDDWEWIGARADYLAAFPVQYEDLVAGHSGSLSFLVGFSSPENVICGEDSVAVWRILDMNRTSEAGVP